MKYVWILIGVIVGEVALILLTIVAQEVIFDGISFTNSPSFTLWVGGFLTFVAAIVAGIIARIAGKVHSFWIPGVISIIIIIEMSYLIRYGITKDPMWFDILAGMSLIFGIWAGYQLIGRNTVKVSSI